jgi:hypothetical protein
VQITVAERVSGVYELARSLPWRDHLTPSQSLPLDGLYLFFERSELAECSGRTVDRIVRVGTHRVNGRFRKRILQHYGWVSSLGGNRRGSIFRKHVGAALLRKADPYDTGLKDWLAKNGPPSPTLEAEVSRTLRDNFTFVCVRVDNGDERLRLEGGLIALLAQNPLGSPSAGWLGRHAFADEIRSSGLWNVQHIAADPITPADFGRLSRLVQATLAGGWGT